MLIQILKFLRNHIKTIFNTENSIHSIEKETHSENIQILLYQQSIQKMLIPRQMTLRKFLMMKLKRLKLSIQDNRKIPNLIALRIPGENIVIENLKTSSLMHLKKFNIFENMFTILTMNQSLHQEVDSPIYFSSI